MKVGAYVTVLFHPWICAGRAQDGAELGTRWNMVFANFFHVNKRTNWGEKNVSLGFSQAG